MLKFIFVNGTFSGSSKSVEGTSAGIGREGDNQIQLLIGGVSRYHARFEYFDGAWQIRDLGSTNGTKVNGKVIDSSVKLQNRDLVEVGEQQFRITDVSAPDAGQNDAPEKASPFVFRFNETGKQEQKNDAEKKTEPAALEATENNGTGSAGLGNLFGKNEEHSGKPVQKSSLKGNLLFGALVIVVAIFCLLIYIIISDGEKKEETENRKPQDHITVKNPFLLYYEKYQRVSSVDEDEREKIQIFQFKLLIENEMLIFSLDDINGGRAYALPASVKVTPEALERLKKEILNTRFFQTAQQENGDQVVNGNQHYSRIVVGFDDQFQDLIVRDIPLSSFDQVEELIHLFLLREYGVDASISKSREELVQEMKNTFDLAEKQYNSYQVQPENLWRAIQNYRIAMKCCEVFEEKPEQWQLARKRYSESQDRLDSIRRDGERRVNMLYQKREYRQALREIEDLMRYFPPESKTYSNMRELKIKIEKIAEVRQ